MKSKCYVIGGIGFRVNSDEHIADSEMYKPFIKADCSADIVIDIKTGSLPPVCGELLYSYSDENVYFDGKHTVYRSYYGENTEYACHVYDGNNIKLTVFNENGLWDSLIFSAVNLPRILASFGAVLCHCSYIVYKGEAVLFSAPKQHGKSTQAKIWQESKNAVTVNGDRAILKVHDGKTYAYGSPYCGSSHISEDVTKPVRAIVFLDKDTENTVNFIDSKKECFLTLYSNLSESEDYKEKVLDITVDICKNTKMYDMKCLPDKSAADKLEEVLWN